MSKIVVLFPGIGYTTDKPLMYYSADIARKAGYQECVKVKYIPVNKENIRGNKEAMEETYKVLYSQAEEQLKDIEFDKYDDVLLVSKSIGTVIATSYVKSHGLKGIRHVLYTPLDYTFKYGVENGIAFIGTKDGWSDYREVVKLAESLNVPIEVYSECNHSLETEDTLSNVERMNDIMQKTKAYIEKGNR